MSEPRAGLRKETNMLDEHTVMEMFREILSEMEGQSKSEKTVNPYLDGARQALGWVLEEYPDDPIH